MSPNPPPSYPSLPNPEPTADQAAALEAGRLLFARECRFINGSATLATIPEAGLPEVAFAGRSNVGKSSLLNALTGRLQLARTSHTPGRTQQINFFDLGNRLMLVDLPGYGYAEAPKTEIARWNRLVDTYLKGRPNLRRVCLLIDARHGMKKPDEPVLTMLDKAAVAYQIVLTKIDKVKPPALEALIAALAPLLKRHTAAHPLVLPTSSHRADGVAALRAELAALALPQAVG